ncbi:hypothetical protein [Methylobacterium sp. Leaf466]|uniref:hypothetical protein n=1 Tax=Methylobacterium sp. Leaf466 TaxID=1736386 RepID=UPI0006FA0A0C|nr:hypothetical protein [Methylobacterium sp. Leaf466]KQT77884.1 hypothetical protein ASG59_11235 [Methylobacterium sp. Leaf466]
MVDGLTDAESRTLVARLDKNHPDLKAATPDWPRRHLVALAGGTDPVAKVAAKPATKPSEPKALAPKKPKSTRALGSAAFAATWDGKDHDAKPKGGKKGKSA